MIQIYYKRMLYNFRYFVYYNNVLIKLIEYIIEIKVLVILKNFEHFQAQREVVDRLEIKQVTYWTSLEQFVGSYQDDV